MILLKFIPFLLLYSAICIRFALEGNVGDEARYLFFAHNLLDGFYSPPYPNINLWNGPGYPAFLAVFLFLKVPLIGLKLLNALLLYLSLVLSYKSVNVYSSKKSALWFTVLLGLYFPIFEYIPLILTECLTWFLISLVCFLVIKSFRQDDLEWPLVISTAFAIAFLVMTKVIFGNVVLVMIVVSMGLFLFKRFRVSAKKSLMIFIASFVFCLPWLFYTYSITGNVLFWADSGSMSMYTMSSPYPGELGDWKSSRILHQNPNHKAFMDEILKLDPIQREKAYKNAAIENIKAHPKKYFFNWLANVGRLLFSYPYSNAPQTIKTYFTILPNMFVIVFIVAFSTLGLLYNKMLPDSLILLLCFFSVYLFGSTLVSAYRRMFFVTIPFWIVFISYIYCNVISFKIQSD